MTRRLGWAGARARPPRGPWAIAAAAAAIAAAAVAIGPSSAVPPAEDLSGAGQPILHDDPAARLGDLEGTRGRIWGSALRAFASDPLTGTGGGSFQLWWQRDVAEGEPVRNAHSLYLETLAELGAPGLLLLAGFLAALVVGAARTRSAAESAAGVAAATGLLAASVVLLFHAGVDWLWQFPALVVVGIGAALVAAAGRASSGRRGRIAGTTRVGLVCLAVIAGAVQVPLAVSASGVRSAQTALSLGHYERAAELAGQAISAQPWAAEPYALRAFVALADERPVAARADIREAIEREPTNWRHRLLLVRATSELGDKEAALRALEALERLRPGLAEEIGELRREVEADRPLE